MKLSYLLVILLLIPIAAAGMPQDVEDFCEDFGMEECNEHSPWFEHDNCEVQIRCNAVIDMEDFSFKQCKTVLRFVMDDCEKNPSSLCYNGIAYDISSSRTCECGGVRFRRIDSCGNPLDWGECIDLESCDGKKIMPHTGATILVKENCTIVEQDCNQDEEYDQDRGWSVTMDSIEEDDNGAEEEKHEQTAGHEETEETGETIDGRMEGQEQKTEQYSGAAREDPTEKPAKAGDEQEETITVPEVILEEKGSDNLVLIIFTTTIALLFLIILVTWVYVSYFKK